MPKLKCTEVKLQLVAVNFFTCLTWQTMLFSLFILFLKTY